MALSYMVPICFFVFSDEPVVNQVHPYPVKNIMSPNIWNSSKVYQDVVKFEVIVNVAGLVDLF